MTTVAVRTSGLREDPAWRLSLNQKLVHCRHLANVPGTMLLQVPFSQHPQLRSANGAPPNSSPTAAAALPQPVMEKEAQGSFSHFLHPPDAPEREQSCSWVAVAPLAPREGPGRFGHPAHGRRGPLTIVRALSQPWGGLSGLPACTQVGRRDARPAARPRAPAWKGRYFDAVSAIRNCLSR